MNSPLKSPVFILGKVFFIELVRDKWLIGSVISAVVLFLFGQALGTLSMEQNQRVVFHLSLSGIQLVGILLAMVLGVSTLQKEVEKQTCLLMLSRPVTRAQFLISKIIALSLMLLVYDLVLGLSLSVVYPGTLQWLNFSAILLSTWFEQSLVLLLAVFGSLFGGRAVAGLFAVGVALLGYWLPDLAFFAKKSENPAFMTLSQVLHYVIPHFYELNHRSIYFLQGSFSDISIGWSALHYFGWWLFLVIFSLILWRKKDLV